VEAPECRYTSFARWRTLLAIGPRFGRFSEFRNLLLVMIAIHITAA
jgi:hypothetical protein